MKRLLLALPVLTTFACSQASGPEEAESGGAVSADAFSPYPYEMRDIHALGALEPRGVTIADFGTAAQDQGDIASCASFGFLGLLENQLFNERGISVDLGERYQLFANFMETGTIGGQPKSIAQFPNFVSQYGTLPEAICPYSEVARNAVRFEADAAQGLTTDTHLPTLDVVVKDTPKASRERADILIKPEFFGRLPQGPQPVTIPLKAKFTGDAKVPEVEYGNGIYSCFSKEGAEASPPNKRFTMTPREFAHACLNITPAAYFTCAHDLDGDFESQPGADDCAKAQSSLAMLPGLYAQRSTSWLNLTMSLLDRNQAVMVGVKAPSENQQLGVWSERFPPGAGHAVLALGYTTYEELTKPEEQSRGMLGQGIFDKLAGSIEPEYLAKALPTDPAARRDARVASRLGRVMRAEGGMLLFKNSWGTKVGDVAIGVDGYQSMTFAYFMKALMLVQSRTTPVVRNVAWQDGGPDYCPSRINIPTTDPWLQANHSEIVAKGMRETLKKALPQCNL